MTSVTYVRTRKVQIFSPYMHEKKKKKKKFLGVLWFTPFEALSCVLMQFLSYGVPSNLPVLFVYYCCKLIYLKTIYYLSSVPIAKLPFLTWNLYVWNLMNVRLTDKPNSKVKHFLYMQYIKNNGKHSNLKFIKILSNFFKLVVI